MKLKSKLAIPPQPPSPSSSVFAGLSPAEKYKQRLREFKKRTKDIEEGNEIVVLQISKAKRELLRLRAERSFLFQKLEDIERALMDRDHDDEDEHSTEEMERPSKRRGERMQVLDDDNASVASDLDQADAPRFPSSQKKKGSLSSSGLAEGPADIPSPSSLAPGKKDTKKKEKVEKDPNAPKKPTNVFLLYCQTVRSKEKEKERLSEVALGEQTKILGTGWKNLPPEEKKHYYDLYEKDKERYEKEMASYTPNAPKAEKALETPKEQGQESLEQEQEQEQEAINSQEPERENDESFENSQD